MECLAIVIAEPRRIEIRSLALTPPGAADVVVETEWSGISTGTEKLLWSGAMPHFPGMGYPLVPGYEAVGRIAEAGPGAKRRIGERVFVPGAQCFGAVRGLFGASARRLVVPESRAVAISDRLGENAVLLALAATAFHAGAGHAPPELIVGHGALGRLLARIAVLNGGSPSVWEREPSRRDGATGYSVCDPETDSRRDYRVIYDASGDPSILDALIGRLAPGGEIVLAGFYAKPLGFAFPPAFMREARFRVAAQWQPSDLSAVTALAESGALSLAGLVTHHAPAADASRAYRTAFTTASCLKMVIDWRHA